MSYCARGLLMQELEAADSGLRLVVMIQGALLISPLCEYGSEPLKKRLLPSLRRGDTIGAACLTEPTCGSDLSAIETYAKREDDEYVLSGSKLWATNVPNADVLLVWARDRSIDDEPIRGFVVDAEWDGVILSEIQGKLADRVKTSGEVGLSEVRVPALNILFATGITTALSSLNEARYDIIWGGRGSRTRLPESRP